MRRTYYGLVTYMDRKVGELLDELEANGLADNMVVIFASDHGVKKRWCKNGVSTNGRVACR